MGALTHGLLNGEVGIITPLLIDFLELVLVHFNLHWAILTILTGGTRGSILLSQFVSVKDLL